MRGYDTPTAAEMYFNHSIFGQLYTAIASLAPLPQERRHGARHGNPIERYGRLEQAQRRTLLDRLDGWFWRQMQKEREAYLARASDVFDLERRIDALERGMITRVGP